MSFETWLAFLAASCLISLSPGAGVVVNTPVYAPFFIMIPAAGRRLIESPLRREPTGEYRYDLEALDHHQPVGGDPAGGLPLGGHVLHQHAGGGLVGGGHLAHVPGRRLP